jgi:N-acetylglucosaminyldiphosphoundecaprenol N-acetyl-beta-D-mannosaminyltransferase
MADPQQPRRIDVLGAPVDVMTMDQMIALADRSMREKRRLQHTAMNVAKLVNIRRDADLRRDVEESDIVTIDGAGVLLAARLLGHTAPGRVTGVDLMQELMGLCERRGYRPFLFGARQEALDRAMAVLKEKHPKLEFAGARNGYFTAEDEPGIVGMIRDSGADCLFVAISTPIKEHFIHAHRDEMAVPFLMGVGGSIDVIAGRVKRAPGWMQAAGLEWFYRMMQEPRRMWRRYMATNFMFGCLLLPALLGRWLLGRRPRPARSVGWPGDTAG